MAIGSFFNCPTIECDVCWIAWPAEDVNAGALAALAAGWEIDPGTGYALCDDCKPHLVHSGTQAEQPRASQ